MIRINEAEEIIRLIHSGFDKNLLSFELDMPIEQIEKYDEQLQLRKSARESIKGGNIELAIEQLSDFIETSENNIIERMMLLKLQAYLNKTTIDEEDLTQIEELKKQLGFSRDIDDVLNELGVQIPRRKNSNMRKKDRDDDFTSKQQTIKEEPKEELQEKRVAPDYDKTIERYKQEIASNSKGSQNKRNLLAFAYFRAGRIDEARDELSSLIEQSSSYIAYRQMIHLEKNQRNFDDAKLWAYECLDNFPNSVEVREQLISIAREEQDNAEVIKQLKEILSVDPNNKKSKKILESISYGGR